MAYGTKRVISPAYYHGALRGVPADGVAGESVVAPGQGKAFPKTKNHLEFLSIKISRQYTPFNAR